MLTAWKIFIPPGIKTDKDTYTNMLLYADNQIILQELANLFQISIHKLLQIAMKYNLKISTKKTKAMVFHGKYPIRTKILIYNDTNKQSSHFNYLSCDVT
jgi:hypothetical protein